MSIFELIYRYGLPGIPLSAVLILLSTTGVVNSDGASEAVFSTPEILVLSIPIGYLIQQFWMLIFEYSGWRYDSPTRPVLMELKRIHKKSNLEVGVEDYYPLWDTILYSEDVPETIREKDRSTWDFLHTNAGILLGISFAAILSVILLFGESAQLQAREPLILLSIVYLVGGVVLTFKLFQTKKIIDLLECYWAKLFFSRGGLSLKPRSESLRQKKLLEFE